MISIIVPVYNTEKYLDQCIQSILSQTYTDYELLLIDDGSTDSSGVICDRYAEQDSRVRVFHKPNGGVSSARNMGLDNARGEWIGWVDSDDYIDADMYEQLYNAATSRNVDIAYCDYYSNLKSTIILPDLVDKNEFIRKYILYVPVNSLCITLTKRKIYKDYKIRFMNGSNLGEDLLVTTKLYYYANNITCVPNKMYYYRINTASICHSLDKERFVQDLLNNLSSLEIFFRFTKDYNIFKPAIAVRILAAKRYFLFKDPIKWYSIHTWSNDFIFSNHFNTIKGKLAEWTIAKLCAFCKCIKLIK